MIAVLAALAAAVGLALVLGSVGTELTIPRLPSVPERLGLPEVSTREFALSEAGLFLVGAAICMALFGGVLPALAGGAFGATFPVAIHRQRRRDRLERARDSWPRIIDEIRILTTAAGRSIPQAILDAGRTAPVELRPAFDAAGREWRLTTELDRMLAVLRSTLADPTCDTVCETLLVAHQLGGADLDRRLSVLAEDRRTDAHYRKESRSKQAGVRFARRFVLLVPLGMAAAGLAVGSGRSSYETPLGQIAVMTALGVTAACWAWSGHMLRVPDEQRVFPT